MSITDSRKVLLAMSGGVDSSVAAALLLEQGYAVIGVTMRVIPEPEGASPMAPCCSLEGARDASRVAEHLGIEHQVVNYLDAFDRYVVQDFLQEYKAGRTPNPCIRCNQFLKFGALLDKADELGADYIATGHYVIRERRPSGRYALRRALYRPKDQSYALACLTQQQLARALFPLGGLTKAQTREKARALNFVTAEKPESQDICFVPDGDYRGFVVKHVGDSPPGPIVTLDGAVLGRHKGLIHYTVGQRKGLGIAAPEPYYVVHLDVAHNAVIVAHKDQAQSTGLIAYDWVWGAMAPQDAPFTCHAQIRYLHAPEACTVYPGTDECRIAFEQPIRGIAPGQWAVLYDEDDYVLGGGIIARSLT